jgi:hypothetical protein
MFTTPEPSESAGKSAAVEKPTTCMRMPATSGTVAAAGRGTHAQLEHWKKVITFEWTAAETIGTSQA